MEINDLGMSRWSMGGRRVTNLISTLVSDHNEEASMIGFDAICDECWNPWVQLFPHDV
jgi:hypothetical protein